MTIVQRVFPVKRDIVGREAIDYHSKLVSLDQALATIRPGSRIYLGTGCAAPRNLLAGLEAMQPGPLDLEFVSFITTSALPPKTGATHRHRTFFVGSDVQSLVNSGQLDYVPISLEEVPALLASGRLPIDVALLQVSPPDARGYVSLGVSVDLAPAVLSENSSLLSLGSRVLVGWCDQGWGHKPAARRVGSRRLRSPKPTWGASGALIAERLAAGLWPHPCA